MTMQIAMVGTDGIVLASDTRWMGTYCDVRETRVRETHTSSKIRINHERRIAIACARNLENSIRIGDDIIAKLTDKDWKYPIRPIEDIAKGVLDLPRTESGERDDAQCLNACVRPTPRLFMLEVGTMNRQIRPFCSEVKDKKVAGDNVNAAIFWSERYYQRKRIRNLVPLAAHLIVAASKLNPVAIAGLEIVLCDASGCRRLSEASTAELESRANEWDRHIEELFASHFPELTYAPDRTG